MFKKCYGALVASILCALLISCGGSGGSSSPSPQLMTGSVSGVAFDSELIGAEVHVSRYDGLSQGTDVTDAEGRFSVDITSESQLLLIETKGGAFVDEYTGNTYQELFGQNDGALRLYFNYEAGSSRIVAPTIYTTLAANLADYLIAQGADPVAAVAEANGTFSALLGIDIETTVPHNVTREPAAGVSSDAINYGFYCAAISAVVAQSGQRPIEFTNIAGDDIQHDGFLDEVTPRGSAMLDLGGKGYRQALAFGVLRMAISDRNRTGQTLDDVLPLAQHINATTDPLFGAQASEIVPLDLLQPTISGLSWWYGNDYFDTVVGAVELTFSVEDELGVESIEVAIGGQRFNIADADAPVLIVNTATLPDGIHPVVITARNLLGITSTNQSSIRIANQGLAIVDIQPGNGQVIARNVAFSATIMDPTGITAVDFFIDGSRFNSPDEGDVRSANYFTPQLEDGPHVFTIRATNGVGIVAEQSVTFVTDNTAPSIDFWLTPGAYLENVATLLVTHDEDSEVILTLNEEQLPNVGRVVQGGKALSSFLLDTQKYADANYKVVADAIDEVGNTSAQEIEVRIDNFAPELQFTLPRNGDTVSGEFHLNFNAFDASGFADKPFEILINDAHTAWVSNEWRSDTVNPTRYGRGWHKVSLVAEDASGKKTSISQDIFFDI